jgi:cytochrome P450
MNIDLWRHAKRRATRMHFSFVSSSPAHMLFGYGVHMCPGRIFATAGLKVVVAHLLLKYDWELEDGSPIDFVYEDSSIVDTKAKVWFRRRREEVSIDISTDL